LVSIVVVVGVRASGGNRKEGRPRLFQALSVCMKNKSSSQSWPPQVSAFIRSLQLKSLRERTQKTYLFWIMRVAKHHGVACPSLLGEEEIHAYIHQVQQSGCYVGSTLHQMVCALRGFYRDHLGKDDWRCWRLIKQRARRDAHVCRQQRVDQARNLLSCPAECVFIMLHLLENAYFIRNSACWGSFLGSWRPCWTAVMASWTAWSESEARSMIHGAVGTI
jgi:hypothetical protein